MNRAYQASFVRMIVDWGQLYIDLLTFEKSLSYDQLLIHQYDLRESLRR